MKSQTTGKTTRELCRFRTRGAGFTMVAIGAALLASTVWPACGDSDGSVATSNNETDVSVDSHGLHSVRNADLRTIMNKLHALHLERITDEIEITGELQRDICDVAVMAESLAADAQLMPLLLRDTSMTDESRRVMAAMSARLRFKATELARSANRNDLPAVRNDLRTMLDTCIACHREFRAPALAMEF